MRLSPPTQIDFNKISAEMPEVGVCVEKLFEPRCDSTGAQFFSPLAATRQRQAQAVFFLLYMPGKGGYRSTKPGVKPGFLGRSLFPLTGAMTALQTNLGRYGRAQDTFSLTQNQNKAHNSKPMLPRDCSDGAGGEVSTVLACGALRNLLRAFKQARKGYRPPEARVKTGKDYRHARATGVTQQKDTETPKCVCASAVCQVANWPRQGSNLPSHPVNGSALLRGPSCRGVLHMTLEIVPGGQPLCGEAARARVSLSMNAQQSCIKSVPPSP